MPMVCQRIGKSFASLTALDLGPNEDTTPLNTAGDSVSFTVKFTTKTPANRKQKHRALFKLPLRRKLEWAHSSLA